MKDMEFSRLKRVEKILAEAFPNSEIKIIDESRRHAKHMGRIEKKGAAEAAQETHFAVEIVSSAFEGKTRIARERMIHSHLKEEFDSGLHSLKLKLKTPEENL